MPFTVSHAAAVLPLQRLTRSRIPLAAMMIGSMAPDFGYFLPMGVGRDDTHDFDGLFLFCLPVGLAVWLLFVRVLERPTIELLPQRWRERIPRSDDVSLKALVLAGIGILIGALTHLAWDAFTHANTSVSDLFPFIYAKMFEFRGRNIRLFHVLQYASSVGGLLALAWWGWRLKDAPLPKKPVTAPVRNFDFLTDRARIAAVAGVIGTSAGVALLTFVATRGIPIEHRVFYLITHSMTAGLMAWCVVAVLINRTAVRQAASTGGL
ncbi:MAG TPA: DUF4184 family protein [Steroidobacteraceae bacterium]|nr:DUF4184 family protein [Steroidobacteraceae bacterium]